MKNAAARERMFLCVRVQGSAVILMSMLPKCKGYTHAHETIC